MKMFRADLKESFSMHWNTVKDMGYEETQNSFKCFIDSCVKKDFHEKFIREFSSSKKITNRFFRKCSLVSKVDFIYRDGRTDPLIVEVVFGSYKNALGYLLSGYTQELSKIFLTEDDSIAIISSSGGKIYFFMDGHTGEILKCQAA